MNDVEEIELNFDVDINNVLIRYSQLTIAYKEAEKIMVDNADGSDVRDFVLTNLNSEIKHIESVLKKVYDGYTAAKEDSK